MLREFGHRMKQCPMPASDRERKHGKPKKKVWCSFHENKYHSDFYCRKQKELQEEAGGTAHVAVMQTAYNSYGPTDRRIRDFPAGTKGRETMHLVLRRTSGYQAVLGQAGIFPGNAGE